MPRKFSSLVMATGAVLTGALLFTGAGFGKPEVPAPAPAKEGDQFHPRLLELAAGYVGFGRVDDKARWAPLLCRMPTPEDLKPGAVHLSASKDKESHGQKLYSLFASNHSAYLGLNDKDNPVGLAIVKESWIPEEVKDDGKPLKETVRKVKVRKEKIKDGKKEEIVEEKDDRFVSYVRKDGKLYHASKQADLFIMYKLDPKTPGTDKGWVYGTVTADGKKVTSAGLVESCMKCHRTAEHDRLFGLPKDEKK